MRKTIVLLTITIGLISGILIGTEYEKEPPEEPEKPSSAERVLTYAPWTDENGRELRFFDGFRGKIEDREFFWEENEKVVRLSFNPDLCSAEQHILEIGEENGQLIVKLEDRNFIQNLSPIKKQETPDPILLLGQELADFAAGFEGCKYVYGGMSPEYGFDCSGLVYYVYDHFGYDVNRIAADQALQGLHVEKEELQPGDVLCFYTSSNYIGHVGIYLGEGYYIHAAGAAYGVVKSPLSEIHRDFEARRFLGCTDLLKDQAEAAA